MSPDPIMVPVTGQMILSIPMGDNDAGAATIRQYLVALANTVWWEGEGFSGKRPFGNSGWEHEMLEALESFGLAPDRKFIDLALAALADG